MIASAITPAPDLRLFPVSGQRLGQIHPRRSCGAGRQGLAGYGRNALPALSIGQARLL